MGVADNLLRIKEQMPAGIELVAVSKFHSPELILEAYEAGQRMFGESRVQEFLQKEAELPNDIRWHFIGHLQTNKVKPLIGKTALIESVDSERLLTLIDNESAKLNVITEVLLQVHVAKEETKFGFYPEELEAYFTERKFENLKAVHIRGLMGMASNTSETYRVKKDFREISSLYRQFKDDISLGLKRFDLLSMGMSGDWELAVEEGANIVRIGSAIFGERY